MNLSEKYKLLDLEALVKIVESPSDYTPEAIETAKNEISNRPHIYDSVIVIAETFLKETITHYLNEFDVLKDELTLPYSYYISQERKTEIFKDIFAEWKAERDDMIPDSLKYIIAGLF